MNRGFLQILALLEKDMYGYSMVRTIRELGYGGPEPSSGPSVRPWRSFLRPGLITRKNLNGLSFPPGAS